MTHASRNALLGYLFAIVSVLLTCVIWLTSTLLIGNRVSSSFFLLAVVVVSRFAGYGPAWLALVLGALPVAGSQVVRGGWNDPAAATIMIVYFIIGSNIISVMRSERIARHHAESNAVEAIHKQRLLEREMSERKDAEGKLRTTESQLRSILDNTPAVVYLKDTNGRYVIANQRYHILFGSTGNGIIGKTDLEIHPDAIARSFMVTDRKVVQEQAALVVEEVILEHDGLHTYRSISFRFAMRREQ